MTPALARFLLASTGSTLQGIETMSSCLRCALWVWTALVVVGDGLVLLGVFG